MSSDVMSAAQEVEKRSGRPAQVPPLAVSTAGGSSPSPSQSGSAAGSSTAGSAGGFATLETLRQQFSLRPQARPVRPVDSLAHRELLFALAVRESHPCLCISPHPLASVT